MRQSEYDRHVCARARSPGSAHGVEASPSTGIHYGGESTGKNAVEDWFAALARSDEIQQFGGGKISRWIDTADTAARPHGRRPRNSRR